MFFCLLLFFYSVLVFDHIIWYFSLLFSQVCPSSLSLCLLCVGPSQKMKSGCFCHTLNKIQELWNVILDFINKSNLTTKKPQTLCRFMRVICGFFSLLFEWYTFLYFRPQLKFLMPTKLWLYEKGAVLIILASLYSRKVGHAIKSGSFHKQL